MIGQLIAAFRTDAAGDLPPAAGTGVRRLIGGGLSLPGSFPQQHIVGRHMELFRTARRWWRRPAWSAALPFAHGLPGDTQQLAQLLWVNPAALWTAAIRSFNSMEYPSFFLWSHHTEKGGRLGKRQPLESCQPPVDRGRFPHSGIFCMEKQVRCQGAGRRAGYSCVKLSLDTSQILLRYKA